MSDGIQQQLNDLNRVVGGLSTAVTNLTDTWQRQDNAATTGRKILHQKLDQVVSTVTMLTSRVTSLEKRIKVIEPSVQGFNEERLRAEGAKRLGAKIWIALTASAGVVGWFANEIAGYFWPKVH